MKAPKNYYNVVDQKKLGLDQIDKNAAAIAELQDLPVLPTPAAGDEGKVPKVNAQGEYELATDEALPSVTTDDNTKMLQVGSTGEWGLTQALTGNSLVVTNNNGRIAGYRTIALLVDNGDPVEFHFLGTQLTFSEVITRLQTTKTQLIDIFKNGVDYCGFVTDFGNNAITAFVSDGSKQYYASIATSSITLTEAKELPSYSSADATKVLTVDNAGTLDWYNPVISLKTIYEGGTEYVTTQGSPFNNLGELCAYLAAHPNSVVKIANRFNNFFTIYKVATISPNVVINSIYSDVVSPYNLIEYSILLATNDTQTKTTVDRNTYQHTT